MKTRVRWTHQQSRHAHPSIHPLCACACVCMYAPSSVMTDTTNNDVSINPFVPDWHRLAVHISLTPSTSPPPPRRVDRFSASAPAANAAVTRMKPSRETDVDR
mmetsp:Transcript_27746/g.79873  ORF Transcript_27746/g.79873 Transcript_27746/m.79873 type:complete len:103 (-) Transcript_27746:1004-1312(-)